MDERIRILRSREYSRVKGRKSWWVELAGPAAATKPSSGFVTGSKFHEVDTGYDYRYNEVSGEWHTAATEYYGDNRVSSLSDTALVSGPVIEAVGIPDYVSDVSDYSSYGITETGWYIFARITSKDDTEVTAETEVTGADGYIATVGETYVDVAVKFDVAALAKTVSVDWGSDTDTFVFRATDLAVRNLDYRTTFYVYDAADFVTWEYTQTTDVTFVADKNYYTESGGAYTLATVTTGEAAIYYTRTDTYTLTADETFVDGKTYYTKNDDVYTAATVTTGESVTADTYYEMTSTYTQASGTFADGVTYYTSNGTAYSEATVTAGDAIPVYYNHSKIIISGLARNITYKLDDVIDCPMEFILPEIEDETHGCWFEIRCIHAGEYSMTLTPPSADVKIATEHTQKETKGVNMIDLHYTYINGVKLWRFMNTHSSIPEAAAT